MKPSENKTARAEGCSHATMNGWKSKVRDKNSRASRTPGSAKGLSCQLTSVAGRPRKFWTRARAYKVKTYPQWIAFTNVLNQVKQATK